MRSEFKSNLFERAVLQEGGEIEVKTDRGWEPGVRCMRLMQFVLPAVPQFDLWPEPLLAVTH